MIFIMKHLKKMKLIVNLGGERMAILSCTREVDTVVWLTPSKLSQLVLLDILDSNKQNTMFLMILNKSMAT